MRLIRAIAPFGIILLGLVSCSAVGQPTSLPAATTTLAATALPTETFPPTIAETDTPEPTSTGFLPAGPITLIYPHNKAVLTDNLLPEFQYTVGPGAIMSRVTVRNEQGFCVAGSSDHFTPCGDDKTKLPWPIKLASGSYAWNVYAASAAYDSTSETYTFIVK